MKYSLEDVFDQIRSDFGFTYIKEDEDSGYIILGEGVRLNLKFEDDKLSSALVKFPSKEVEISDSRLKADIYLNSIEVACQIVDLIQMMLGK